MLDGTFFSTICTHTTCWNTHGSDWQWLGLDRCWGYGSVPQNLPASALHLPGHSHALTDPAGQRWTEDTVDQWTMDISYIHVYTIIYPSLASSLLLQEADSVLQSVRLLGTKCKGVPRWKFLCGRAPFWLASWDSESSAVRLATMASFSVRWNLYALSSHQGLPSADLQALPVAESKIWAWHSLTSSSSSASNSKRFQSCCKHLKLAPHS